MDPQLTLGGNNYHKTCARCATCNGVLSIKNFSTSGDRLLCKTHFKEEFSQGGGVYAGDDKFKHAGSRSRSTSPVPTSLGISASHSGTLRTQPSLESHGEDSEEE